MVAGYGSCNSDYTITLEYYSYEEGQYVMAVNPKYIEFLESTSEIKINLSGHSKPYCYCWKD